MSCRARPAVTVARLPAFTLLETLLAVSLGTLILFAAVHLYSQTILTQQRMSEQIRLQQQAHQLLDYLRQALLNAGYQGIKRADSNFPLFLGSAKPYHIEPHCLIVLHDLNADGCLGSRAKQCVHHQTSLAKAVGREIVALKAENRQLFVLSKYEQFSPCHTEQCRRLLKGCHQLQWDKLADIPDHVVEKLHFQWLKPDVLLEIQLRLASVHYPDIRYEAHAQAYLLNGREP